MAERLLQSSENESTPEALGACPSASGKRCKRRQKKTANRAFNRFQSKGVKKCI